MLLRTKSRVILIFRKLNNIPDQNQYALQYKSNFNRVYNNAYSYSFLNKYNILSTKSLFKIYIV